ncbi:MAG: tol-pal system protein YbgF [Thermoanaerobaculia bacterium]
MTRQRTTRAGRLVMAAGFLAAVTGCVSGSDIDGLHKHLSTVEKEVDAVSKQSSSKEEVAKLNETLAKQAQTLLRSNADLGTKFDDLTREMQALAGKLEDANRRLTQLSQQIAETQGHASAGTVVAPPAPAPASGAAPGPGGAGLTAVPAAPRGGSITPADLFAQATADYQRGRYDLARQGFEDYAEKFPRTDLSDDALYWAGECWSAQKKSREAITAFDKLFRTYPQSDKAPAAHLKKGIAHLELGEKAQAMVELNFVVNQFPGSDEAKSARQRLKSLGGDSR